MPSKIWEDRATLENREVSVVGDGTWLSVGEVADSLGISVSTVRRYVADGRLDQPVRTKRLPGGGHRRIHKDSVARLAAEIEGDELTPDE